MATIKDLTEFYKHEPMCGFCGYDEYKICLTAHHIFPKHYFKPQPHISREDRYIILCPTCHSLLHRGIFVKDGRKIIEDMITYCELKYANLRNINNIIKLARMVYSDAYKCKAL